MVGWAALQRGRLSLLVRGCGEQQSPLALGVADIDAAARRGAALRGAGRDDRALHLGAPQPALSSGPRGAEPALYLSSLSLSKAISSKICRKRRFGCSRKTSETTELGVSSQ